jgi:cyclopropane-fatty-acyl-phospholipid synthase
LRAWAVNFDNNWQKIHALDPQKHNEYFRRMWRFFLYGCAGTFIDEHSPTGLFQILFSKGKTKTYPMTRDFLYPSGVHIPAARSGRS